MNTILILLVIGLAIAVAFMAMQGPKIVTKVPGWSDADVQSGLNLSSKT